MTKITSRLLTLLLAFSMVFTTFGFVGGYEVNAASGDNLLQVKIVDGDGTPVQGVELQLVYATDEEDINKLGETDADGTAKLDLSDTNLFFWPVEGPINPNVRIVPDALYYIRPVSTEYEYDDVTVSFGLEDDFGTFYIVKVNGSDYSGSTIEMTMTTQGSNPNPVDYVDMQASNKAAWDALTAGVALEDVNEGDLILDVRDETHWAEGRLPNSIHVNITTATNLDGKYVKNDTPLSRALDAAYEANGDGKIVVVCNSGQSLAARALQYYNANYYDGKGVDEKVTYLKGGAKTGFGDTTLETAVDYVVVQKTPVQWEKHGANYSNVTSSDFILDVRSDDAWKKGFLPGSVHISVSTNDTALVNDGKVVNGSVLAKALDSAFAASEGKRIVLVCNSGQVLAARAMEYFNSRNYGGKGVDLSRVTFLIGGASNQSTTQIPAEKKVTTLDYIDLQKNNKPAWNANGIPYADITDDDFILDVRNDDLFAAGHLKGSTHVKVTDPASDLDNGYVKAESDMAKALDAAYATSGDKRIVVICNTGNSLAARALQYFNTKNCGGSGADYTKLTFLIGGYGVIPASDVVTDEDEAAADAIEDKINALPAADKVTTADKAAIEATRKAYDALSDAQKKLVDPSVLKKLTDAEAALKKAEDAAADTNAMSVKTVTVNTKTVNKKAIDAAIKKAGGTEEYVTTIILGKKVKKISKGAFKKYTNVTNLEVKTKKLKKKAVKASLKGSKVKTIKVNVGKKKANKAYVKKYKKIFTKKNAGKKVKVK